MKDKKRDFGNNSGTEGIFSGTHQYYVKYRPSIPEGVTNVLVEHFGIKPSDRILDIGCGTGQVAMAMEGRCGEVVGLDPDPEMLKWAKKITHNLKIKLTWYNNSSQDLVKLKKDLGVFKVATMCRAFNWMNQEQVLNDLDGLIDESGGVVVFGDKSFWTGDDEWQQAVKEVVQKYLGEERRAGKGTFKVSAEPWDVIIARSVFRYIKMHNVPIVRNWDVASIIGYLFSTSFAAPDLFGDQIHRFKEDVKTTLLALNPKGMFQESAVWSIILGSKIPR